MHLHPSSAIRAVLGEVEAIAHRQIGRDLDDGHTPRGEACEQSREQRAHHGRWVVLQDDHRINEVDGGELGKPLDEASDERGGHGAEKRENENALRYRRPNPARRRSVALVPRARPVTLFRPPWPTRSFSSSTS
jgi:hypothetical protein